MSEFVTSFGLKIQSRQIVGGYSNHPGIDDINSCISANGEIFESGDWRVTLDGRHCPSIYIEAQRLGTGKPGYSRGIHLGEGWLLLGYRAGKWCTKFIPSSMLDELCGADFVREEQPDGEYSFDFDLRDDNIVVLVSDGGVFAHLDDYAHPQHITYIVIGASWVAYCESKNDQSGSRSRTVVTELDGLTTRKAIEAFLDDSGLADLSDLLDAWSELIAFDAPFQ